MEAKLNRKLSQLKDSVRNFESSLSIQTELFPEIVNFQCGLLRLSGL